MRGALAGFPPRRRNRARGVAGAECGGALQAIVAGQRAQGLAGAECRGSLVSYAVGYAGAEAAGAPAVKALGFAGAEAGGTLQPATPTYSNGFKNFLEFLIPEANVFGTGALNNYLGSIDDTFPALRTVANGGLVEHASGYDMQVEFADGTVLPFARPLWDATTGRIVARPRFSSLPKSANRYRLFFGKAGVTTDGANEGSAYAAHLAAPNIRTGADRTGLSRTWTPTGITAGTLGGYAATFNGTTSQLVRANPTELNGLNAITIQALVQLSSIAANRPIFVVGPTTGSDFGIQFSFDVATGRLGFLIRVGANTTTVQSVDGVMPAVGVPILVAARWSSGNAPSLYANGALLALSVEGTALTGVTNATLGAASSEALIGYNRAGGTRWAGQIADLMVSARVLSEAHLQTQERNYLTPRDCYGAGEANSASQLNLSPVLPPIFASATVGQDAEVDPALVAYEGDSGQVKSLESHVGDAGGTFSTVGGRARFRPSAVGRWPSTAVVKDNGTPVKRSAGRVIWTAEAASGFPKHPPTVPDSKIFTVGYAGPAGPANQYDSLDAAYGAIPADGGYQISLNNAAVTKTAGWTFDRAFGSTVVIRSRNPLGATLNGKILAHQGRKLWLYELETNCPVGQLSAEAGSIVCNQDFTITRCRIMAVCGVYIISNTSPNSDSSGSFSAARRVYVGWCAFKGRNSTGVKSPCHIKMRMSESSSGPSPASAIEFDDFAIYRCFFYDPDSGNNLASTVESFNFYCGNKKTIHPAYYCSQNGVVEYCFADVGNNRRFLYPKRGIRDIRYNHCAGFKNEPFTQRHGWDSRWVGNRCSAAGGDILIGGGRKPSPYNAGFTEVIGNVTTGGLHIKCGTSNGSTVEQAANYALVVGNQCGGQTIIGHRRNSNFLIDPAEGGKLSNLRFWEHSGGYAAIDASLVDVASCDIRAGFTGHGITIPSAPVLSASVVGLETAAQ